MYIGNVQIQNNVFLAPMAGVTDMPFRLICKEYGCGLTYTEMASTKAFFYSHSKTQEITNLNILERPAAVQIFGHEPEVMAYTAQGLCSQGVDIIDINMGCPTPKIVKNSEGSALMLEPKLAEKIISAVVKVSNVPVTVKMRRSWDDKGNGVNATELAKIAEQSGAQAVAVHGRTREQFYSGKADWQIINDVKKNVEIPVIGNGDIEKPEDAKRMLETTGCDAVMIGRAAQGNPWIFSRTINYLETGKLLSEPTAKERISMALRHFDEMLKYKGDHVGLCEMRKHIGWYIKGLRNAASMREKIVRLEKPEEVIRVLVEYMERLAMSN